MRALHVYMPVTCVRRAFFLITWLGNASSRSIINATLPSIIKHEQTFHIAIAVITTIGIVGTVHSSSISRQASEFKNLDMACIQPTFIIIQLASYGNSVTI